MYEKLESSSDYAYDANISSERAPLAANAGRRRQPSIDMKIKNILYASNANLSFIICRLVFE